jgi:VanZ family protein
MITLRNFSFFTAWFFLILYLSFAPLKDWPKPGILERLYFDKVVHLTMYAGLCFFLVLGFYLQGKRKKVNPSRIVFSVILCASIGLVIEWLQPVLTQFRRYEWADMLANVAGSALGYPLFSFFLRRNRWRQKPLPGR